MDAASIMQVWSFDYVGSADVSLLPSFCIGFQPHHVQAQSTKILSQECFYVGRSRFIDLGGGFKYFSFSPLFGEMIQFDEHIFQMGGSTTKQ